MKLTVPEGVPAVELTVAVRVNVEPLTEGFGAEVTTVVLAARLTTWLSDVLVLPRKDAVPEYVAVIGCVATENEE